MNDNMENELSVVNGTEPEGNEEYMKRAIELAGKGGGFTAPNPLVGAVIVKNGRIIGEGYHEKYGGLHAERRAFESLTESAEGADLYVTLEPCCHTGKTPPCTEAIIKNKISRVFVGSRDPNPLVSGKGNDILRENGIGVIEDFMKDECDELNPAFFHFITTKMPYVVLKYAMTLDGKIAAYTGASKWITGKAARRHVHELRGLYSAVMVGIGTVIADDPLLNCRIEGMHQPLRIVVDSKLRIPLDCRLCRSAEKYPLMVVCVSNDEEKKEKLRQMGVSVCTLPSADGKVDIRLMMEQLGGMNISSVLLEGGGDLNEAALRCGVVSHVCAYIAPKIMGGKEAKSPVEGKGAEAPDGAVKLCNMKITHFEEDILLEYDVKGGPGDVHGDN